MRSPFKKDSENKTSETKESNKTNSSKYKQGELKKGWNEGIKSRVDITMDQAVKEAEEKNRLAEIKREQEYGIEGVDY